MPNPTGDKSDLPQKSFKTTKKITEAGHDPEECDVAEAKSRFSVPFFELRSLIRSEHMTAENVKQS